MPPRRVGGQPFHPIWSLLCGRFSARATTHQKRPVEAAGAVDAKNAPTAPWKTGRPVFHSYHRLFLPSLVTGKVSPMFPVNFVTYVPGCTRRSLMNCHLGGASTSDRARPFRDQRQLPKQFLGHTFPPAELPYPDESGFDSPSR